MTFAEKVLSIVSKIPRGSVMTYKEVAKLAGRKHKLVPLPRWEGRGEGVVIPCHRVVKSNGEVGGYVGGGAKKKKEGC